MSVKSTVTLTRHAATERYVYLRICQGDFQRALRSEAALMKDGELEDQLERLNDEIKGGEGFENYRISDAGFDQW